MSEKKIKVQETKTYAELYGRQGVVADDEERGSKRVRVFIDDVSSDVLVLYTDNTEDALPKVSLTLKLTTQFLVNGLVTRHDYETMLQRLKSVSVACEAAATFIKKNVSEPCAQEEKEREE